MKISFIIPFYNTYEYTKETIKSINEYVDCPFEILIVNDDRTKTVKFSGARVVTNTDERGSGGARNTGIRNIDKDSTHIFFIDSDDTIASKEPFKIMKKSQDEIIEFNYLDWYKNKKIINRDFTFKNLRNQIWGISIPVKLMDDSFFWKKNENNDTSIKTRILLKHKIHKSDAIAINYRIRKSSVINSRFSEARALQEVFTHINRVEQGLGPTSEYSEAYFELLINKKSFPADKFNEIKESITSKCKIRNSVKVSAFFYRVVNFWHLKNLIKSIFLNRKRFK